MNLTVKDLTTYLETIAPLHLQESYDNSGLLTGNFESEIKGVLVTLDVTEDVIEEAIQKGCNVIVSHHPVIFKGLKKLTGSNYVEKCIIKAIKNDIALYASHTNLDNVSGGVNTRIAIILGLENVCILAPKTGQLQKLVVFVPQAHTAKVQDAVYAAGAGNIGLYSNCSFKTDGIGSFKPNDLSNPFIGQKGIYEEVEEDRLEVIFPVWLQKKVLDSLKNSHPYEEIAYYIHNLENKHQDVGSGAIGELNEALEIPEFLNLVKTKMKATVIRYTNFDPKKIKKVAVCGGVGSFLLDAAKNAGADAFLTADFKYHEFFDAQNRILITDIGHFESEQFTKDLLVEIISKKFSNFATYLSDTDTNPIKYYF